MDCVAYFMCVGPTIRTLRTQFGEHQRLIKQESVEHGVPRHFAEKHKLTEGLDYGGHFQKTPFCREVLKIK